MKTPRIADSVNYIDDDLLLEAAREEKHFAKKTVFLRWGALAACFCVLMMAVILVLPNLQQGNTPTQSKNPLYKPVQFENRAIIWPWEYKAVYEKYLSPSK